jgi:tellurite resistance protein TerC
MFARHPPAAFPVGQLGMMTTYEWARRIAISVAGGTVLLIGVVMIVTPGPAFVLIPAGLAILGVEYAWARYWLKRVKEKARAALSGDTSQQK